LSAGRTKTIYLPTFLLSGPIFAIRNMRSCCAITSSRPVTRQHHQWDLSRSGLDAVAGVTGLAIYALVTVTLAIRLPEGKSDERLAGASADGAEGAAQFRDARMRGVVFVAPIIQP
jgi:hypothetical protein